MDTWTHGHMDAWGKTHGQSWAQLPLTVDPLVNGTALILHFENVNLTEERLFLSLLKASTLKI